MAYTRWKILTGKRAGSQSYRGVCKVTGHICPPGAPEPHQLWSVRFSEGGSRILRHPHGKSCAVLERTKKIAGKHRLGSGAQEGALFEEGCVGHEASLEVATTAENNTHAHKNVT